MTVSAGTPGANKDLTVKGEAVERVYGNFCDNKYLVNRRYQRKLVWSIEEKQSFIDSIAKGFPVPIILLAEYRKAGGNVLEIIDGMQRLNAVTSFIDNEYCVDGEYFDLNTMAQTKALLDSNELTQRTPLMSRDECIEIARYTIPFSIYEFSGSGEVDEVFRRINSGGRKLSRQELRMAGATGHFANLVRKVATSIRGDASSSELLTLANMKSISISSKDVPNGLDIDSLFWVVQGVLTKEQVRESRDEEILADMLAWILSAQPVPSRSEFIDDYFFPAGTDAAKRRYDDVNSAVQKNGEEILESTTRTVFDELKRILVGSGRTFTDLLFKAPPPRAPRYFQVVFLALYHLLINEKMEVSNYPRLVEKLVHAGDKIAIAEGGRWSADDRQKSIDSAVGIMAECFTKTTGYDPARVKWITKLENLMTQSKTEQAAYDFKQGFLRLDGTNKFDEDSFGKILDTLVAIANLRKGVQGYVIIGVVEKEADARRVEKLHPKVKVKPYLNLFVTGVDHEMAAEKKNADQFFQMLVDRVSRSDISEPLRGSIARHMKLVRYYDSQVIVFESTAQEDPSNRGGRYFDRRGNQLQEIDPKDLAQLFRRFASGL